MPHLTIDRRTLLGSAAATAGLAAMPALAATRSPAGDPKLAATLDAIAEETLVLAPETATFLGLDKGRRAGLKAQLARDTAEHDARWAAQARSASRRLSGIDAARLDERDRVQFERVRYAADQAVRGAGWDYAGAAGGFFGGTTPYTVSQQGGAVGNIPEFLDTQHTVETRADAEAYLSRLEQFALVIDDETAKIQRRAGAGVILPRFVGETAIGILKGVRATPVAEQKMVVSLARRTREKGIAGDWSARATRIVESRVMPALDRQIAALQAAQARATDDAGVWKLPDGEAYYAWALGLSTTTDLSPAEVHRLGREQNEALKGRIDAILKAQGMTRGTVGERVASLNKDPRQLFPDNDAGREQAIAYCNQRLALIRPLMGRLSHMRLKADVQVKRVPPDIQDGAALGYMNPASLDGVRPAIYYINLKSTSLWPKYQMASLTAHEGVPGHAWQFAYLAENGDKLPATASVIGFNAFTEGWALYSEQLIDEAGLYDDDPWSRIGYLQALQFRACRMVVDTGLHAMKWTRQQSIDFLARETGKGVAAVTSETDRYCVAPGQACGYKVGHSEIVRLRAKAEQRLGKRFDLAGFNDALVQTCGVPLTVLEGVVDRWAAGVA